MRADADEHRLVLAAQLLQRHVRADRGVALQFHTEIQDPLDLGIQNLARQAVFGDAVAQHPARLS